MLLDTSGLFAYLDENDARHEDAVELFLAAPVLLTHSYVLAELVPLLHTRGFDRQRSVDFQQELLDSPDIEIIWVDASLHRTAVALLEERIDKGYSLCDAVSFVLMRSRRIHEALTTDHHFEQEGFVALLRD